MMIYCPDCQEDVYEPNIEDHSFEHEFGTEWIFDYHCPYCERLLRTIRQKPKAEFDEPY